MVWQTATQSLAQDYFTVKNLITGIQNTAQGYSSQFLADGEIYCPEREPLAMSKTISGCVAGDSLLPVQKTTK